ncbi:MAG: o-succinylbenzoate--CoA ligase [bacterium]|nr:o-succinylbenzoate--CoA ligase [bacterium]
MTDVVRIQKINIREYRVPFISPLRIGDRTLGDRQGLIIELTDSEGETGYGEIAPLDGFSPETVEQAKQQTIELTEKLPGMEFTVDFFKEGRRFPVIAVPFPHLYPSVRFGLETAVVNLLENRLDKSFSSIVSGNPREKIAVNALLQGELSGVEDRVGELLVKGFKTIKIKVGRGILEEDIEMVNRVVKCLLPGVVIRLDANRLWDIETAIRFGRGVDGECIEYIEEPFADFGGISRFYGETGIAVGLDESLEYIDMDNPFIPGGVKAFVLKPVILGGIERTGRFIDLAERHGIVPVISSCFEVGEGFGMLLEMAASIDFVDVASGLDTLKYLKQESPIPIKNGAINLSSQKFLWGPGAVFSKRAPGRRRQVVVIAGGRSYTYRQLDSLVCRAVSFFQGEGIVKGTRVALVRRNSLETIVLLAALWRIGAVAVPLNFRFPSGHIDAILKSQNIRHVYFDAVDVGSFPETGGHSSIDMDNAATIILRSGSTGREKAVLHTYGNHYYNALGSNENIRLKPGDRWLLSLPLFHVGGLGILFRCFMAGAAVVVPSPEEPLVDSITKHKITHVSLISTQLYRLLNCLEVDASLDLSHLGVVLLGGSGFPWPLIERALLFKLPIYTTYGLSEMASQVVTTPPGAAADKLFTSGKLLRYRQLRIDDNNEICVKGRTLFKGYVEGSAVSLPVDSGGWFHTGDLGRLDGEGYLNVLGRRDNMFISGGENIMPEEIEVILNNLPEIRQSVVVPVPDDTYGSRPAAFLKLDEPVVRENLLSRLKEKLPRFKIPDFFYLWPLSMEEESLKVKRPAFRELLQSPSKLTLLFRK